MRRAHEMCRHGRRASSAHAQRPYAHVFQAELIMAAGFHLKRIRPGRIRLKREAVHSTVLPDRQHLPRSRIAQLYAPQALSAWNNAARDHTGCHRALRANGTRRAFGTYRTHGSRRTHRALGANRGFGTYRACRAHGSRRTHRAFGANRGFGTYRTDRARRAFRNRWALGAYRSGRAFRTNRRRGADRTCRARRTFRLGGRFHASSDQPYAAAKRIPMQFKPAALLHPKPGQRRVALDASARGVGVPHRVGRKYASVDNRWKGQPYAFRVHQHKKGFRGEALICNYILS